MSCPSSRGTIVHLLKVFVLNDTCNMEQPLATAIRIGIAPTLEDHDAGMIIFMIITVIMIESFPIVLCDSVLLCG